MGLGGAGSEFCLTRSLESYKPHSRVVSDYSVKTVVAAIISFQSTLPLMPDVVLSGAPHPGVN